MSRMTGNRVEHLLYGLFLVYLLFRKILSRVPGREKETERQKTRHAVHQIDGNDKAHYTGVAKKKCQVGYTNKIQKIMYIYG